MAININNETFHITTSCTSYIFDVYKGYLRHIYYGKKIEGKEFGFLKRNYRVGCVIDAGLDGYEMYIYLNILKISVHKHGKHCLLLFRHHIF